MQNVKLLKETKLYVGDLLYHEIDAVFGVITSINHPYICAYWTDLSEIINYCMFDEENEPFLKNCKKAASKIK